MNYPLFIEGGQSLVQKIFGLKCTDSLNDCLELILIIWIKLLKTWLTSFFFFFISIPLNTLEFNHK